MAINVVKQGLDLPIGGTPDRVISETSEVTRVRLLAADYLGVAPRLLVQPGDRVRRGQALLEDERIPGLLHTASASGAVGEIRRDAAGRFLSLEIHLSESERMNDLSEQDFAPFTHYTGQDLALLTSRDVKALLLESGLWTALRTRPFGRVAHPERPPKSIFVNAMDTHPLAPPMELIAEGRAADLHTGLLAVAKLTDGYGLFCRAAGSKVIPPPNVGFIMQEFQGPHPGGTAGLHMHRLEPVGRKCTSWYVGLADVLAIGALFRTGRMDPTRVISLAGPGVARPRLLRARLGASIEELTRGELLPGPQRVISGSVLTGRTASSAADAYLGRYHAQISVLPESPRGQSPFCLAPIARLWRGRRPARFAAGPPARAGRYVPSGVYERVMPFELPVMHLLSALAAGDHERAAELGALELEEEDVALCSVVCPARLDYGALLRATLTALERECAHE